MPKGVYKRKHKVVSTPFKDRKFKFLGNLTISEYNARMFAAKDPGPEHYQSQAHKQTIEQILTSDFEEIGQTVERRNEHAEKITAKYCVIGPKVHGRTFEGGDRTWFWSTDKAESHARNLLQKNVREGSSCKALFVVQIVRVVRVKDPAFEVKEVV